LFTKLLVVPKKSSLKNFAVKGFKVIVAKGVILRYFYEVEVTSNPT